MSGQMGARSCANRRGVALIIVLGFLALMVMMAVAFLTHARTERMVAGVTMEGMRGRQILRTALNAAMNDFSGDLSASDLIMPTLSYQVFRSDPPPGGQAGMGGRTLGDDDIDLMVGEVEDWIPRRYQTPGVTNLMRNARWILVREDPSRVSRILVRYAYVCLDMSGGIDANLIARDTAVANNDARVASNRVRRSIRQVPMRMLRETIDAGQFKSYRQGWKGFDSLYSLIKLTDGKPNDGNDNSCARWMGIRKECLPGPALASNLVSDLTPFSMSAFRGARYNKGSGLWSPYVLVDDSTTWATALDPVKVQFGGTIPAWIPDAIHDYTHLDNPNVPRGLDYPSPKNVPMFNELQVGLTLDETVVDASQSTYSLRVSLTPEFWYPFPSEDNKIGTPFWVEDGNGLVPEVGGGVTPTPTAVVWVQILPQANPPAGVIRFKLNPPAAPPAPLSVSAKYEKGVPYVASGTSNLVYNMDLVAESGDPLPPNLTVRIQGVTLRKDIFLTTSGGDQADKLPAGLDFPGPPGGLNDATAPTFNTGKAAVDPRLNHDFSSYWVAEGPTLGQVNTLDPATLAKFQAEGTNMYCRNGPMETPAELGFISTGKAEWETIDLCTAEGADMMATLVTDTNLFFAGTKGATVWDSSKTNVFYTNGTININTRSTNVLASAFVDLATHEVPRMDSANFPANPVTEAQAGLLAQALTNETVAGTLATAFQAGTDWARIPAMQQGGLLSADFNNNQREGLIRNTWGLFNPDNSLFTVILIAQTIKEGPDPGVGIWDPDADIITGERRAVALVWRDPFKTGQNPHHEMFVRMFRHLND